LLYINSGVFGVCSYDLIFSSGLFMYMSDDEVHSVFTKALSWLRPGGYMFFCETCFKTDSMAFYCTNVSAYMIVVFSHHYLYHCYSMACCRTHYSIICICLFDCLWSLLWPQVLFDFLRSFAVML